MTDEDSASARIVGATARENYLKRHSLADANRQKVLLNQKKLLTIC